MKTAIGNTGNFIPREIKELSSNYPKPVHVSVVATILEEATRVISNSFALTHENVHFDLRAIDTSNTIINQICPTFLKSVKCEISKYRTLSGMCNNLDHPSWGSARSAMIRYLVPVYEDGISEPRSFSVTGNKLPNARWISKRIHSDESIVDAGITVMLPTWGQIVVHDINFGAPTFDEKGEGIRCCDKPPDDWHPACYVFDVPANDTFYTMFNRTCMNFVRLSSSLRPNCPLGPREPMNIVSGYLDGSSVYGSNSQQANDLREHKGGLLKSNSLYAKLGLKDLLPLQSNRPDFLCQRHNRPKNVFCFKSGDERTNQQLPLTLIHTILMREHNRIANALSNSMPELDDETIYEEARRILSAEMQIITYREFLPIVLGEKLMTQYGLNLMESGFYSGYDSKVNAEPRVAFQAAAFRFGHSIITDVIRRYDKHGNKLTAYRLSHLLRQPFELYKPGIVDTFILGLVKQEANRMDSSVTSELTNHLFERPGAGFGSDLASINIMRARELGVPPYNAFREYCNLPKLTSFDDLVGIMNNVTIGQLRSVYESVDDIDLWTGGSSEFPMSQAIVGPTFGCLIGEQFASLRKGDRFWFENNGWPSSFSSDQLDELRKVSLARLICDNSDVIASIQLFPMLSPDEESNPLVECSKLPSMDLKHFLDGDVVTLKLS